jgi:DNA-binding transcriptional LysR family regulator
VGVELRQMRYFVAVAERRSFTRAAQHLYVAQQALSQQVKALEDKLGVRLLDRTSRRVELTAAGAEYLADCRRLLAAAARAEDRVRAVAGGTAGRLRVAYTLTAVYDTIPRLVEHLARELPGLKVDTREMFAGDVCRALREGRCDVAIAPMTGYPTDLAQRTIRREPMRAAVADHHRLATAGALDLARLAGETFQLWPREMAPGYYDVVVGACRTAGFEPALDDTASGSTAWANIAAGRGVNLVVGSLAAQLPRGITLVEVRQPRPELPISAVWPADRRAAATDRFLDCCGRLGREHGWLGSPDEHPVR